jgi:hypothetical protein
MKVLQKRDGWVGGVKREGRCGGQFMDHAGLTRIYYE